MVKLTASGIRCASLTSGTSMLRNGICTISNQASLCAMREVCSGGA